MASFELSTELAAPPDAIWEALQRPETLQYVARGWLRFRPIDPPRLPRTWPAGGGEFRVALLVFGWLPLGTQTIAVEYPDTAPQRRALRDNGHGGLARRWDHWIFIEPAGPGSTRYTDRLTIEAGLLTWPVTLWAKVFYAYRQRRWHDLVANGLRTH